MVVDKVMYSQNDGQKTIVWARFSLPFSTCPINYYLEPKDEVKTLVSNKKQRMKKIIIPIGRLSLLSLSFPSLPPQSQC